MSKIEDLLNHTVREDTEIKRWVVVAGIAIIVCITICGLYGVLYFADVDGYLQESKPIIGLYDFYDQKVGENETAVFFFGSSLVKNFVYPVEINRLVKINYPNITSYNLAIGGEIPIERTLEIQKIIDAKPSLVIFGVTYRSVNDVIDNARLFDRTKPVYSRLNIRDDSLWLYTDDEMLYFTPLSDFEKKKYLFSALEYKISEKTSTGSFDPFRKNLRPVQGIVETISKDKAIAWVNKNRYFRPDVTKEQTRYKDALIYNVKTLQNAGIPVIIINMPLHPLLSDRITDESRVNFYELLNETGADWYDFERNYDGDYFVDGVHANFDGALKFAPRMADLIIEQVEKDVIHYT